MVFIPPKGIRLNNPGNIEHGDKWQGLAADQPDKRFCAFTEPEYGIRAIVRIMRSYKKAGIDSVHGVINRWAPPSENPTRAYAENVARWAGLQPDESIDITDPDILEKIIPGIIRQENGMQPYDAGTIRRGIALGLS